MELQIGNKFIGEAHPVFIVAELSANHLQDYELAVKTIRAMKESGADAVKLQTYTPDTITLDSDNEDFQINQGTLWDGQTLYNLYKKAYTPWEWMPKLKKLAEELGMACFSSEFDKSAVDFTEQINMPLHKIASFEVTDIPLIEYMASKNKPVIISTGIATLDDIEKAVLACKSQANDKIILLKCTSEYPAPYEEANLKTIQDLEQRFSVLVGLSDHTSGISVPVAAVALGAKVIEKHFILDRSLRDKNGELSPDTAFSLEPHEFKQMVESVRQAEKALGKVNYALSEKTKKSREFARSLYVSENIKKGEIFTEKNVRSVRPGFGLHPENLEKVLGKKAVQDIKKGTRMSWELVDNQHDNIFKQSNQTKNVSNLILRIAALEDSLDLFNWRNDPVTREMSRNTDIVLWESHRQWYQKTLTDAKKKILIAENEEGKIGMVRFDYQEIPNSAEININLNPSFRGRGFAQSVLNSACDYGFSQLGLNRIYAEIKKVNTASIKIFERAGFAYLPEKDLLRMELLKSR